MTLGIPIQQNGSFKNSWAERLNHPVSDVWNGFFVTNLTRVTFFFPPLKKASKIGLICDHWSSHDALHRKWLEKGNKSHATQHQHKKGWTMSHQFFFFCRFKLWNVGQKVKPAATQRLFVSILDWVLVSSDSCNLRGSVYSCGDHQLA